VAAVLEAHGRVYPLTFYKAGSQWVRDVLADPRLLETAGFRLGAGVVDIPSEPWPAPSNTTRLLRGPINAAPPLTTYCKLVADHDFSARTGRAFEESFPRLLIDLGYEQSAGRGQALDAPSEQPPPKELERRQWLTVLEEFTTELSVVRIADTARIALEQNWTYKLGFLPLRRLFGLFKDGSR